MKITTHTRRVNPQRELLVSFDVSKQTLNLFCQYPQGDTTVRFEDAIANATGAIEETLARLQALAQREGFSAVRVLCESTGGYERALLQSARRLGHKTALVNPEHVCRLKKVESNDTGKTDHKDPRVIDLVARLGKTQRHRQLPDTYQVLRRLTSFYDQEEKTLAAIRTRIEALIVELFPDGACPGLDPGTSRPRSLLIRPDGRSSRPMASTPTASTGQATDASNQPSSAACDLCVLPRWSISLLVPRSRYAMGCQKHS